MTFSSGESVSALADGDEETTITGVTVSNPESIPSVFYKQFLDQSFGDTGELDLKNAVKNTTFNINLSNGESKTVTGLGAVRSTVKKCPRTFSTNGYFRKSDGKGDCRFE